MSLNNLVERMNVKRDYVPPVAQVNDGLGIEAHQKMKMARESLIALSPAKTNFERILARKRKSGRDYHNRNKKKCNSYTAQWLKQARKKPEYRAYLNELGRNSYKRCKERKVAEKGIDEVRKEWREKQRRYKEKLLALLTPEQIKERNREISQKRRAREIEKYGGIEGYRAYKREQSRKRRERKKNV